MKLLLVLAYLVVSAEVFGVTVPAHGAWWKPSFLASQRQPSSADENSASSDVRKLSYAEGAHAIHAGFRPRASNPSPSSVASIFGTEELGGSSFALHDKDEARALWAQIEARGRYSACWKQAAATLAGSCSALRADDVLRGQLALSMAACDSEADGRLASAFHCTSGSKASTDKGKKRAEEALRQCIKSLSEANYAMFVQYRLHTDVMCAYLQEELFQERTESAVAALQEEALAAAESLHAVSRIGANTAEALRASLELQQEQAAAGQLLRQELGALKEDQATSLHTLQSTTQAVLHASQAAGDSLAELQAHMHDAAADTVALLSRLSVQAGEQFAALEEQTAGLVHVVSKIEAVHSIVARRALTLAQTSISGVVGVGVLVVTGTLPSAAQARVPAVMFVLAAVAVPLLTGRPHLSLTLVPGFVHVPWLTACLALAVGVVVVCVHQYVPPALLQRQMVTEVSEAVAGRAQEALQVWFEKKLEVQRSQAGVYGNDAVLLSRDSRDAVVWEGATHCTALVPCSPQHSPSPRQSLGAARETSFSPASAAGADRGCSEAADAGLHHPLEVTIAYEPQKSDNIPVEEIIQGRKSKSNTKHEAKNYSTVTRKRDRSASAAAAPKPTPKRRRK